MRWGLTSHGRANTSHGPDIGHTHIRLQDEDNRIELVPLGPTDQRERHNRRTEDRRFNWRDARLFGPRPAPGGGAGASDPLAFLFRAHPIAPPLPCLAASLPPFVYLPGAV